MSRRDFFREQKIKKMVTTVSVTLLVVIVSCVTIFVMYSKSLKDRAEAELLALAEKNEELVPNEDIEITSMSQDKTVENSIKFTNSVDIELKNSKKVDTNNTVSKKSVSSVVNPEEKENMTVTQENKTELSFKAPVSGEIIKDYAMDTLIFSETLGEWCTHNGIDIKADKTSVVIASENGTVESIKNDPRYGLTVILKHENGFKTVYSNLLTTEFVNEGENVEKGQTIATVGNSASFEISDDSHLHFEMYKDGVSVNPTIYLKD